MRLDRWLCFQLGKLAAKLFENIASKALPVEAGVRTLDASCGGIGGCPFAPAATGNIPTEDLIYMLNRMGCDTGVDLPALLDTSRWLQGALEHAVPGMLVKAGPFPYQDSPVNR